MGRFSPRFRGRTGNLRVGCTECLRSGLRLLGVYNGSMRRVLPQTVLLVLVSLAAGCKDEAETAPAPTEQPAPEPEATPEPTPAGKDGIGLGNAIAEAVGLANAPAANVKLLPGAATLMAGVDLAAVSKTGAWATIKELAPGKLPRALEVATTCKVGPDTWKRATMAADPKKDDTAVLLEATGIGKTTTLDCLHDELRDVFGREPWASDSAGKRLQIDDDAVALVVSDNALIITSPDWEDAVQQRREGNGPAAEDGVLAPLMPRTQRRKHLWIAAVLPDDAHLGPGSSGPPAKDVTAWIDLADGLHLHVAVGVDDPKAGRTQLDSVWSTARSSVTAFGIPQPVVDSVKIGDEDGTVTVEAKATDTELAELAASFTKLFFAL